MATPVISTKRLAISKVNAQVVGAAGAASFVVVFCLIASKAVLSQNQYLARVTTAKETANRQLQTNLDSYKQLKSDYAKFDKSSTNWIGGSSVGTGDKDGSNSKLVLNALPQSYDFPALASSIEKVLVGNGYKVASIAGTDDQLAQQANSLSPTPLPVPMPFSFTVNEVNFDDAYKLSRTLETSIRPIQIDKLILSGANKSGKGTLTTTAHTYYQPGRSVDIKKQVIK